MNPPSGLADDVAGVIKEVAAEVLEPCFAERSQVDAWEKTPGELVTAADIEAERVLALRLAELLPGVPVVGEECGDRLAGVSSSPSAAEEPGPTARDSSVLRRHMTSAT